MNYYIYGEITNQTLGDVKSYIEKFGGDITININSQGGNVFSAIAIYNLLKDKGVTFQIEGLCASAATIITCAGRCIAPKNALFIVHNPFVELWNSYTAAELEQLKKSLDIIQGEIVDIYRTKVKDADLVQLMDAETWLTAEEAAELGFIDEVTGETEIEVDAARNVVFVNKMGLTCRNLKKFPLESKAAILNAERERVKMLQSKKGVNAACDKIIELAIECGESFSEVERYYNALKDLPYRTDALSQMIKDNLQSGAEGVGGGGGTVNFAAMLAQFTNDILKGGKGNV